MGNSISVNSTKHRDVSDPNSKNGKVKFLDEHNWIAPTPVSNNSSVKEQTLLGWGKSWGEGS